MSNECASYDRRALIRALFGITIVCAAMKATGGVGAIILFFFVLGALGKNRGEWLLYSLLMVTCITVSNNNFAPKGFIFSIVARFIYLFLAMFMTLQLTGQRRSQLLSPFLWLLLYIAYMALVSAYGWNPTISYLKLLLYVFVFFAFYSVTNAVAMRPQINGRVLRSVLLSFMVFFILGSTVLIAFPGWATMGAAYYLEQGLSIPEGSLFMGMTDHSQSLGTMMAMMGVLLVSDLLFSVHRWDKLYLLLIACAVGLMFKSGSRTAMGTFVVGCSVASLVFMNARGVASRWRARASSVLMIGGILVGLAIMVTPAMRSKIVSFMYKYAGDEVAKEAQTFDNLISSRQGLIDDAMENFHDSPWIGNGFQVSLRYKDFEATSWKQLLSAPIEKGVWIPAVLEEGGVFGMILFVFFLLIAYYSLLSYRAYIGFIALFSFMVANLGEFTFFSMSSSGGFFWSMVFTGVALDAQRLKEERLRRQMALQGPAFGPPPQGFRG